MVNLLISPDILIKKPSGWSLLMINRIYIMFILKSSGFMNPDDFFTHN